jgi:hypothetical protein
MPTPRSQELAEAFCRVINEWLDAETLAEVNRRNALPEYEGCCATHDFCDPNQAMLDALAEFGIEFEGSHQQELLRLMNEAWTIAREGGFRTPSNRVDPD